jgi:hypothetical protein
MFNWIRNLLGSKPEPLKASAIDRAIVADVMARSGVPFPDARVADRIAFAARTVITTVDLQAAALEVSEGKPPVPAEKRRAMDRELDRVQNALRHELVDAGARLSGSSAIGYEIMRRLRAQDDRGAE